MKDLKAYIIDNQGVNVNILVGRFQPFTLGHLKCCEGIYKERGLKTVLCMIETIKSDKRHPFTSQFLMPIYKQMIKDSRVLEDIILVKSADIVEINKMLSLKGLKAATWTCGTDRYEEYKRWVPKYDPEIEIVEIKRGDKDISATMVRQSILDDDESLFRKLTPRALHKHFKQFKVVIDDVLGVSSK